MNKETNRINGHSNEYNLHNQYLQKVQKYVYV